MIYALGAVKPNVKKAAEDAGNRFGITTIYGVGQRDRASDHPKGLALDFMTYKDQSKGDQVAAYFQQNYAVYSVTYIIWKQRIWSVGQASEGWRAMEDRGSVTENHYDHVHVSFADKAGKGGIINIGLPNIPNPIGGIKDGVEQAKQVAGFLTDSHNWLRVGMFGLGILLVLIAAVMLTANVSGDKPADVAKYIKGSVKKGAK